MSTQEQSVLVEEQRKYFGSDFLRLVFGGVRRFARPQPVGFVAGVIIALLVLIAVFGSSVAPYEPFKSIS